MPAEKDGAQLNSRRKNGTGVELRSSSQPNVTVDNVQHSLQLPKSADKGNKRRPNADGVDNQGGNPTFANGEEENASNFPEQPNGEEENVQHSPVRQISLMPEVPFRVKSPLKTKKTPRTRKTTKSPNNADRRSVSRSPLHCPSGAPTPPNSKKTNGVTRALFPAENAASSKENIASDSDSDARSSNASGSDSEVSSDEYEEDIQKKSVNIAEDSEEEEVDNEFTDEMDIFTKDDFQAELNLIRDLLADEDTALDEEVWNTMEDLLA